MKQFDTIYKKWFGRLLLTLIGFLVFKSSIMSVLASTVNSGLNPHSPISETYVQGEIASAVWAEVGLRRVLSKNEVGLDCEDLLSIERRAARGSGDVVNVFRVYGGKAKPNGFSWTSVNPNSVGNFRNTAGLPNVNTGRFVIEGTVKRSNIIKTRSALPLDGNKGGLLEYIIDPKNVNINRVSGANPGF